MLPLAVYLVHLRLGYPAKFVACFWAMVIVIVNFNISMGISIKAKHESIFTFLLAFYMDNLDCQAHDKNKQTALKISSILRFVLFSYVVKDLHLQSFPSEIVKEYSDTLLESK